MYIYIVVTTLNIPLQLPNNHFYTRPSCLIPKELFPTSHSSSSSGVQRKESTSSSKSAIQQQRSVRLPLRKHHSFHFQPSQTVAGVIKSHKRHHRNNREESNDLRHARNTVGASSTSLSRLTGLKARIMGGGSGVSGQHNPGDGPLIFKPYDENSAFKPIQPITNSSSSISQHHPNKYLKNNKSLPISSSKSNNNVLDSHSEETNSQSTSINNTTSSDAKSTSSNSSGSDRMRMPKTSPHASSSLATTGIRNLDNSKRLVYADLLDTSKSDGIDPRKVNCIPKPSRTQYATITFPEVNI